MRADPNPGDDGDCFDAALTAAPTLWLNVADVVDLLHVPNAPERIAEYRAAMGRGERFPPVAVVRLFGRFYLADGHKRFTAFRALGRDRILVERWSTRRWLGDQARQLAGKTAAQCGALLRSPYDPAARGRVRRLFWDAVGHWRRIARSLASLPRR